MSAELPTDRRRRFAWLQAVAVVAVTAGIGAAGAAGVRSAGDDSQLEPDAAALSSEHSPGAGAADRRASRQDSNGPAEAPVVGNSPGTP